MSREHLYKAKRVNWRELPKEEWWVEGLPSYDINGNITEFEVYKGFANFETIEVELETVCEYTGLTDGNGRKIFEGDIVKIPLFKPDKMAIGFIEGAFCLANSKQEYVADIHYIHHAGVNQTEVVGNIFDNTELL